MTYRIKRMGWLPDPLDHRDFGPGDQAVGKALAETEKQSGKRILKSSRGRIKSKIDLRKLCPRVENQGDIGSCTAHAVVGLIEYLWKQTYKKPTQASRLFLYKATRNLLGWCGDTGAFVRSTIKAARLFGVCPESHWPYAESAFDAEPPAFCYSFAQNYKAIVFYRLQENVSDLRKSLAQGIPFAFGFTCYESLDEPEVFDSGEIPFPDKNESETGGHAVMAVGYDDKRKHFIIRNSWGDWGDEGYGYLPYKYFDKGIADDCWCILKSEYEPLIG